MTKLFEQLLRESVRTGVDLPILVTINNVGTIKGEIDSCQPLSEDGPPLFVRVLNASLVDLQNPQEEPALLVPRPPVSSAVLLPGGPNRRWMVTLGSIIVVGEEVDWDQWLDFNSTTNGGDWSPEVVTSLKARYPLHLAEEAVFHLINVRFLNTQIETNLGSPVHVPVGDVSCCGNRW